MDTELRYWETPEYREKYSDDDRKALAKKGHAMPDGSYPITDQQDLENAIQAVGRGGSDHDAIRKHIIQSAARLGHSDMIPDNWNSDGSLKQENSASTDLELRAEGQATATTQTTTAAGGVRTPLTVTRTRKPRHRAVPLQAEVRYFQAEGLEVRSADNTDEILIVGYPIVYNQPYTVRDMFGEFTETMHPGVASGLFGDVRFLFNHNGMPLARTLSRTMTIADLPDRMKATMRLDARQQLANDLAIAIERGDVSQMSVGFIVAPGGDRWDEDYENRDIFRFAEFLDVSAVTYPASPTTSISMATRMLAAIPVESRARLRMLDVDTRAGKVLSAANASKLVDALNSLHDLAAAGGVEIGDTDETGDENSDGDGPSLMDDGTIGGGQYNDGAPGYDDGTGTRDGEPNSEQRDEDTDRLADDGCPHHEEEGEETEGDAEGEPEESSLPDARTLRLRLEARKRLRP